MELRERAMLAKLKKRAWGGTVTDREVSDEIIVKKHAEQGAGSYQKKLVAAQFKRIISTPMSAATRVHRVLTSPWDDDGTRILTNSMYTKYTDRMRQCRQDVERARDRFCEAIDEIKREAKEQRLGTMYREEDYPTADDIAKRIGIEVEIWGMPDTSDFRAKLTDAQMKAITKGIEKRINERIEGVITDIYERTQKVIANLAERLKGDPTETIYNNAMVLNVQELIELIPALNITDDKKVAEMCEKMKELVEFHPAELKDDSKKRKQVGDKADRLLRKVNDYLA